MKKYKLILGITLLITIIIFASVMIKGYLLKNNIESEVIDSDINEEIITENIDSELSILNKDDAKLYVIENLKDTSINYDDSKLNLEFKNEDEHSYNFTLKDVEGKIFKITVNKYNKSLEIIKEINAVTSE